MRPARLPASPVATDDDDRPRGRALDRREALAMLGASGLALWLPARGHANTGGMCVARPEQTAGPFFIEDVPQRADIRAESATGQRAKGTPLRLDFAVGTLAGASCAPLAGARVDVWQCDAEGRYSDVAGDSPAGRRLLRGYQLTGADGTASFVTVYPGAYAGRAVHMHFRIRTAPAGHRTREFTSQLYFDDALSDRVFAAGPYPPRARRVRNGEDFLYRHGGRELTLAPTVSGDGLAARFDIGLLVG